MIFSSINRTILSKILAIFIAEQILCWVPKKTHSYDKLIKPDGTEVKTPSNDIRKGSVVSKPQPSTIM